MSAWTLPVTVAVGGQLFSVRSDFRAVLDALAALGDAELPPLFRRQAFLQIFYPDWQALPSKEEALHAALQWVNLGRPVRPAAQPPLLDWQKDAALIAPAVDQVLGYSCRACAYLHWWDFIGAYENIRAEGLFATVVAIRAKRARGQALEKAERAFFQQHREFFEAAELEPEEEAERKRLLALLDGPEKR